MSRLKDIVVALDLSTKPGYAIFNKGKRIASGTSHPGRELSAIRQKIGYPMSYVMFTEESCERLMNKLGFHLSGEGIAHRDVNAIIIEETTSSSQNYSQKILEFMHFRILQMIAQSFRNAPVYYIRDGVWKSLAGARLTDADKKNNAKISRLKRQKRDKNPHLKKIIVRKDNKGNPVKKVTAKDAYINRANDLYDLNLTKEDEDQAAALLIGLAYYNDAPVCDGTTTGGLMPKENEDGKKKGRKKRTKKTKRNRTSRVSRVSKRSAKRPD